MHNESALWAHIARLGLLISLIWFFLHPLVNISSGEPKPRGVFVDEHGNSINSLIDTYYGSDIIPKSLEVAWVEDMEFESRASVAGLTRVVEMLPAEAVTTTVSESFMEVIIYAEHNPTSQEAIVFVVPDAAAPPAALFIANLARHLSTSRWLSKNVVFLLMAGREESQHKSYDLRLDDWLNTYHSIQNDSRSGTCRDAGLLRDGLVLDLWGSDSSDGDEDEVAGVQLLATGFNGAQANMDVVSVALMTGPRSTFGRSSVAGEGDRRRDGPWLFTEADLFPPGCAVNTKDASRHGGVEKGYVERLRGLVRHMMAGIRAPDGLHVHFLQRNIEGLTLRGAHCPRASTPSSVLTRQELLEVVVVLTHAMCNLHEELHHSLSNYLFMGGSDVFVGMPELASNVALLLVSTLVLLVASLMVPKKWHGTEVWVATSMSVVTATLTLMPSVGVLVVGQALGQSEEHVLMLATALEALRLVLATVASTSAIEGRECVVEGKAILALGMLCPLCALNFSVGYPLALWTALHLHLCIPRPIWETHVALTVLAWATSPAVLVAGAWIFDAASGSGSVVPILLRMMRAWLELGCCSLPAAWCLSCLLSSCHRP